MIGCGSVLSGQCGGSRRPDRRVINIDMAMVSVVCCVLNPHTRDFGVDFDMSQRREPL
jgi:hypothetical protein